MDDLPVIDIGPLLDTSGPPEGVARVAEALDRACRTTGFFLIEGHGVPEQRFDDLVDAARAFFALPVAAKEAVAMATGGRAWRGWFPEGAELTAGRPDHKEGFYVGEDLPADDPRVLAATPLHGPNRYPLEVPALGPAIEAWMAEMTRLGHALVRGLGVGLGLDPTWFDEHLTADPTVLFRLFRYPPRPPDDPAWGVAEHTDYGLLTILAHDGSPGLQVRGDGGWVDVAPVPGTFVVNLGDMVDRMTGGRYRSTPHRVRHRPDGTAGDRLSFPFFFDPAWDAQVRPVPAPGPAPSDDAADRWDGASVHTWSGTYGDYLTAKVARVFPALAEGSLGRDQS